MINQKGREDMISGLKKEYYLEEKEDYLVQNTANGVLIISNTTSTTVPVILKEDKFY